MSLCPTDERKRRFADDRLLDVRNLGVRYKLAQGGVTTVLEGIGFSIEANESLGLLGESGAGKTSLVLATLGLLARSATVSGAIVLRGRELTSMKERELRRVRGREIAFIPQEPALALNPVICVGQQIADIVMAHTSNNRKGAREKAEAALQEVGLFPVERIYSAFPHQLSGGQRQRVVIAQALVCDPVLLLADEPTSSLDQISQSQILGLLSALRQKRGFALLLISHDPWVISEIASRIIVLKDGRIVDQGTTPQMFASSNRYTQELLSCVREQAYAQ